MNFCPLKSLTYLASLAKLNESFSVILKHRNIVFIFVWQNLCHGLANCDQFNFQISQNGRFERILLFPTQILSFLLPYFMLKFIQYFFFSFFPCLIFFIQIFFYYFLWFFFLLYFAVFWHFLTMFRFSIGFTIRYNKSQKIIRNHWQVPTTCLSQFNTKIRSCNSHLLGKSSGSAYWRLRRNKRIYCFRGNDRSAIQ